MLTDYTSTAPCASLSKHHFSFTLVETEIACNVNVCARKFRSCETCQRAPNTDEAKSFTQKNIWLKFTITTVNRTQASEESNTSKSFLTEKIYMKCSMPGTAFHDGKRFCPKTYYFKAFLQNEYNGRE